MMDEVQLPWWLGGVSADISTIPVGKCRIRLHWHYCGISEPFQLLNWVNSVIILDRFWFALMSQNHARTDMVMVCQYWISYGLVQVWFWISSGRQHWPRTKPLCNTVSYQYWYPESVQCSN